MAQYSKLVISRAKWKAKSILLSAEVRQYRRKAKRSQAKITELRQQIAQLTEQSEHKKNIST